MAKEQKTNVMRILDKAHIPYAEHTYDSKDGAIDGMSVASKLHQNVNQVFKTLVTQGHSKQYYIFVIPLFCVRPCQSEYLFCGMVGIPSVRRW